MSLRDGVKHLLLRVVPLLVLSYLMMMLSQSKGLPTEITWAQLLAVVSLGMAYLALYRAVAIFWRVIFGRDDEPDLDPSLWGEPTQDEMNEMAVNVLSHELAHAVVSHRLGLKVLYVDYSPYSGSCHVDAHRGPDLRVDWAGMSTIYAAGLLAPAGPPNQLTQHGNSGPQDDAASLWRNAAYAAAVDGQSITHHAESALQCARELMPEMTKVRQVAEQLMVSPTNGWRSQSLCRMVPDEDLRAFLRNYDPSTA